MILIAVKQAKERRWNKTLGPVGGQHMRFDEPVIVKKPFLMPTKETIATSAMLAMRVALRYFDINLTACITN